ncbi:MAG: hypothetical protein ACQETG_10020, partial [Thermodesulfobacteriota bacterium]
MTDNNYEYSDDISAEEDVDVDIGSVDEEAADSPGKLKQAINVPRETSGEEGSLVPYDPLQRYLSEI